MLTKVDPRVKGTSGAEQIESSFAVVTLAGLVDLGLRKDNQGCAGVVPLQLHLVALEEGLLGDGSAELRDTEYLNRSRLALESKHVSNTLGHRQRSVSYLAFGNKHSN